MSIDKGFFRFGFQHGRAYEQSDRERIAELNAPPPRNDPKLLQTVKVRVLKPFYVAGKVVEEGQCIELARHDAVSMQAIGRVEILS